jgi:hypothetical protein
MNTPGAWQLDVCLVQRRDRGASQEPQGAFHITAQNLDSASERQLGRRQPIRKHRLAR